MLKTLTLSVPKYLQKFLVGEYSGEENRIHVEKWSQLGSLIDLVSRSYPFPLPIQQVRGTSIQITYYCREKSYDIPPDKYPALVRSMDELFRRAMICEVRKVHEMAGGAYGPYVRSFLDRYDITADVDCDFETMRKIYRDYLARNDRKNTKNLCAKSPAVA
ncbi:hypothetical protein [Fibrella aquatica]|uniref:hypothetical protein n=1 Tax=Fibrella aquatica TaxID=3242487 RepID=UPI00352148F0